MIKKETIQLKSVKTGLEAERSAKTGLEEKKFVVKIKVENPLDRTLYAYGTPRRIFYNNSTRKLTLLLHDQHLSPEEEERFSPHLKQPRFVPLEANTGTEIILKLPTVYNRIRPAAERGNGPMTEKLRIAEATEIELEIAHQDTPFYYDPKKSNARQFKEWGEAIAKATFKVTPLNEKEGEPDPAPTTGT